jgi:asparaginyl-tRNA synthetase
VVERPFQRITYTDAVARLQEAVAAGVRFKYNVAWGDSLQAEHEKYLAGKVFNGPVFITHYPAAMKPFYMRVDGEVDADAPSATDYQGLQPVPAQAPASTVACMDLIVPGIGELCGGSQREERFDILAARVNEAKLNGADYQWYLDLRRFGTVPHSGWGMGFERFVTYITGMENIRDTVLAPRAPSLMKI